SVRSETPSIVLPSLLRYVDNILMRNKYRHDHPPPASQTCVSCNVQWDNASTLSTFLPLSPCNHWVHYRCLISLATRNNSLRDKCPMCKTQLFEWDGINALTLATRTSMPMDNEQTTIVHPGTGYRSSVTSDRIEYEQESLFIDDLINQHFLSQLTRLNTLSDGSPDLVQCFNELFEDIRLMGRPKAKWLMWNTTDGLLLFRILVSVKMHRFLMDGYASIMETEAWVAWEEGCRLLQKSLLESVHSMQDRGV
ncbi:hypothetical protein C7974DRAFT_315754, partial [Boeremia exigua]|uniref:uncharacterized protein n=1 Tax=Boeremia exigua TaxID=749465 RepID=UPI001E8CCE4B